jgi:hypothetical protein
MRRLLLLALTVALVFALAGCGEEAEEFDLSTPEGTAKAFVKAVEDKDEELFGTLVVHPNYIDEIWPLVAEKGLVITGGFELEEGVFGTDLVFESALYEEEGSEYTLELTLVEDQGKWVIGGYTTMLYFGEDAEETEEVEETEEDDTAELEAQALEYLQANYTDAVKAVSDSYAGGDFGGDVQYYIHFVDGKFDKIHSVATGHGDDRAYNNEAFRAELDALVETFEVDVPGEVDVFWVMEFPM